MKKRKKLDLTESIDNNDNQTQISKEFKGSSKRTILDDLPEEENYDEFYPPNRIYSLEEILSDLSKK